MTLDATVGGVDSNSYVTLAEFEAYIVERGISVGTVTDAVKEGWLIRAAEYIDANWIGQWKGLIASDTQALAWPRTCVVDPDGREVDDDSIPLKIKNAQCEMAVYAKTYSNLNAYAMTSFVEEKSSKAGPVEASTKYSKGSATTYPYTNVGKLLSPYLKFGFGGYAGVVRT